MGAAVLVTNVVAVPIGSWLLSKDLWLPYWFSTPIILLAFPIIVAIPETLSTRRTVQAGIAPQVNDHPPITQSKQVNFKSDHFILEILGLTVSFRLKSWRQYLGKLTRN